MSFLSTDDCASSEEGLQVEETSLQDEVVSGRSMKHDILGIFLYLSEITQFIQVDNSRYDCRPYKLVCDTFYLFPVAYFILPTSDLLCTRTMYLPGPPEEGRPWVYNHLIPN